MCDPETKRGVLNDFDLARLGGPNREPSGKDNTGTLPFLALDLLNNGLFAAWCDVATDTTPSLSPGA
jgi:hypothetical protein